MSALYELRAQRLVGSNHVKHAIYVDGALVHEQLSPYSEDEIESRISAYRNPVILPPRITVYKEPSARPGRRKKAAEGQTPWLPEDAE